MHESKQVGLDLGQSLCLNFPARIIKQSQGEERLHYVVRRQKKTFLARSSDLVLERAAWYCCVNYVHCTPCLVVPGSIPRLFALLGLMVLQESVHEYERNHAMNSQAKAL